LFDDAAEEKTTTARSTNVCSSITLKINRKKKIFKETLHFGDKEADRVEKEKKKKVKRGFGFWLLDEEGVVKVLK